MPRRCNGAVRTLRFSLNSLHLFCDSFLSTLHCYTPCYAPFFSRTLALTPLTPLPLTPYLSNHTHITHLPTFLPYTPIQIYKRPYHNLSTHTPKLLRRPPSRPPPAPAPALHFHAPRPPCFPPSNGCVSARHVSEDVDVACVEIHLVLIIDLVLVENTCDICVSVLPYVHSMYKIYIRSLYISYIAPPLY